MSSTHDRRRNQEQTRPLGSLDMDRDGLPRDLASIVVDESPDCEELVSQLVRVAVKVACLLSVPSSLSTVQGFGIGSLHERCPEHLLQAAHYLIVHG